MASSLAVAVADLGRLSCVAGERVRVNASVTAQARGHMGSSDTHVKFRHTCVYTWNTHMYTTETVHAARAGTQTRVEIGTRERATWNTHLRTREHRHLCAPGTRSRVFI